MVKFHFNYHISICCQCYYCLIMFGGVYFWSYGPVTVTYCLKQGSSTFSVVKYGERPHRWALQAAVACRLRVGDLRSQTRKLCFFWGPHVAIWNEILQKWSRNGQDSPVCSNSILIVTATDHNTICCFFCCCFFCSEHGLKIVYDKFIHAID